MPSDGSVTHWLQQLQVGEAAAAQPLWERYFHRLVALARHKLQGAGPLVGDEEDVALSALKTFWRNAEQGRFPELADRDGLWRLLAVLTARKAAHLLRDQGRRPAGEPTLEQLFSREPTPDLAAQLAEDYRRLLDALADRELESIAVWKREGHKVKEIAGRLNYNSRTIKRKLQLIRAIWEKEVGR
jgi:DNA-directed RNA polymerase specialized sigma24 family protein